MDDNVTDTIQKIIDCHNLLYYHPIPITPPIDNFLGPVVSEHDLEAIFRGLGIPKELFNRNPQMTPEFKAGDRVILNCRGTSVKWMTGKEECEVLKGTELVIDSLYPDPPHVKFGQGYYIHCSKHGRHAIWADQLKACSQTSSHKCSCSITQLMATGCKCGGI